MEKTASCFILILLGIILSLTNYSICHPTVQLNKRQIIGRTVKFNGKEVNKYSGIRYAEPPIGELRFKKTKRLRKVPTTFKAVKTPPACLQYSDSPYPWYVNGSHKSEDCLFLNIWTPVDATTSNKKAVLFWIHGGGFKFGSIQDPLYNGVPLAAFGDIIVVTINYRLGAFGFLTTGTDEAPGNAGLWDILEALKWVNRNIGFFGGDTSRITISGESAGSIAAGYLSITPLAQDLFSRIIMESGSPATLVQETKVLNLALTKILALKVGCGSDFHDLVGHGQSVAKCLKELKAEDLARAESEIFRGTADFLPQYGDKFLPKNPRRSVFRGDFRCKNLLIGNNLDEGSFILTTSFPEMFGFFGEKNAQTNHTVGMEIIKKATKKFLPDLQSPIQPPVSDNPLLKDVSATKPDVPLSLLDNLLQKAFNSSMQELYTLIGDMLLTCPDEYYAEKCAEIGGDVYFYFFAHRPSTTPWAPWMGVAHYEEIQFVFGKPLLEPEHYQVFERVLSRHMIEIWSNFVKTGRPNDSWPVYSKKKPVFRYLGKRNATEEFGIGPHKQFCDLFRLVSSV